MKTTTRPALMESLENRRMLSASSVNFGPSSSAVLCEIDGTGYRRVSVGEAVDYWIDFYDRFFDAIADDIDDGFFFGGGVSEDFCDGLADFYRDFLPDAETEADLRDGFSNIFSQFGAIVPGGGGGRSGAFFSRGGSIGGGSVTRGDGQAKASRYDGGVFNEGGRAASAGASGGEAVQALGGSVGGLTGSAGGGDTFSDIPIDGGNNGSRGGGVFGGGYS